MGSTTNLKDKYSVEQLIDWLCEGYDHWDRPLSAVDFAAADPRVSRSRVTAALKYLVSTGLLYSEVKENRVVYMPTARQPVSDIQTIICKGLDKWQEDYGYY